MTLISSNGPAWFLIAAGVSIPNILAGYWGSGADYRFAMYISGLFVAGWGLVMGWGFFRPRERRGLLPITAFFLLASIVIEIVAFPGVASGALFIVGALLRVALTAKFMWSYLVSRRQDKKMSPA